MTARIRRITGRLRRRSWDRHVDQALVVVQPDELSARRRRRHGEGS